MSFEMLPVAEDRAVDFGRAIYTGFHDPSAEQADLDRFAEAWVEGRWWTAQDDGRIVATVRTEPFTTTFPGRRAVPTSGLTGVTTLATHRRQGLLREMLRRALVDDKERGEPVSTLIAAEYPIYGRFGYGAATEHATYTLNAKAEWLTPGSGTVEMADSDMLLAEAPAIYDQHLANSVSEISRSARNWRNHVNGRASKPRQGFAAICRDDAGVAQGFVMYEIESNWTGRQATGVITIDSLIAATPDAEARLWRYLCDVDWVTTIKASDRSTAERVPWWLVDGRDFRQTEIADFVWARPLDVPGCLTARTYATAIDAVMEITDPFGLAAGRFHLVSDGRETTCVTTTKSADLAMPISTLGSILFGAHSLRLLATVGRVDEHTSGTVDSLDVAFRTATPPWSATWF